MADEKQDQAADEADELHHQMIVEYVGSDPSDSGGCLGSIVIMAAGLLVIPAFVIKLFRVIADDSMPRSMVAGAELTYKAFLFAYRENPHIMVVPKDRSAGTLNLLDLNNPSLSSCERD